MRLRWVLILAMLCLNWQNRGISVRSYPKGDRLRDRSSRLTKRCTNPELGKAFIDFIKRSMDRNWESGAYQLLTNKTALSPSVAIPLSQAKLLNYDFEWAGRNRASGGALEFRGFLL